jgi:hypothetical protein
MTPFQVVSHRGRRRSSVCTVPRREAFAPHEVNRRWVQEACAEVKHHVESLLSCEYICTLLATCVEIEPCQIIVIGIGHVCDKYDGKPRWQLALLLMLHKKLIERYPVKCLVEVHEPVLDVNDRLLLSTLFQGCICLRGDNVEGKVPLAPSTVVYMPHCPCALYGNLLCANWAAASLSNTIWIGNSFIQYLTRAQGALQRKRVRPISKVSPFCTEIPIMSKALPSPCQMAFLDFSVHIFPLNLADIVPVDFFTCTPPFPPRDGDVIPSSTLA